MSAPKMPDFLNAFDNLEGPISLVARRARVASWVLDGVLSKATDEGGYHRVSDEFLDVLASTIWDFQTAAEALETQWQDTHVDRCDAEAKERAISGGRAAA